ncbi:MAG TPA: hypothetical protein VJN18_23345 [Polyangiaceae bacterium]|nr:hypothetical protein [Polyangiaceae bacterium]
MKFWRSVHERTGYRISPLWRALLGIPYAYCVFPAVAREARKARVRKLGSPVMMAVAYNASAACAVFFGGPTSLLLERVLQAAILGAAQLAVNRLSDHASGTRQRAGVTTGETLCLIAGAGFALTQVLALR